MIILVKTFGPELKVMTRTTVFVESAITKETVPCEADVPYGEGAGEKFDLFGAPDLPAGGATFFLFCFIRFL
jgi:hypothetical protein